MEGKKLAATILSVSCKTLMFVLFVLLLYFVGRRAFEFGRAVFVEKSATAQYNEVKIQVTIPENYTMEQVGDILFQNGLITDKKVFSMQARLSYYYNKLTPGTYELSTAMKPSEMLAAMYVPPENETGQGD